MASRKGRSFISSTSPPRTLRNLYFPAFFSVGRRVSSSNFFVRPSGLSIICETRRRHFHPGFPFNWPKTTGQGFLKFGTSDQRGKRLILEIFERAGYTIAVRARVRCDKSWTQQPISPHSRKIQAESLARLSDVGVARHTIACYGTIVGVG